jgi:hypothetical protein
LFTLEKRKQALNEIVKENKSKMAHIQNPDQFISMLDQAIKYWHTPKRDKVLDKLIAIEDKLAENGFIKYDIDAINGFNEFDELEDEPDSLEGKREQRAKRRTKRKKRRARFFKAVKRIGKKVGSAAKKVAKAIVKYNPLSIAIRGGLLVALRLNMFGISKKLQYAYLPISAASKHNIDVAKLKDLKKRHARVKKLFRGLQGKESNLKNAILKGAKQRNSDFSLKGTNDILSQLKGLEAVGELAQLGDLGVVAAAASVGAASGVLAKIKSWLRPVKNIFNKVRGRAASKKIEKLIAKGKEISPKLRQRVRQYYQQQRANQPNGQEPAMPTIPTPTNYTPTIPYAPQQVPYEAGQMSTHVSPIKGMSKKVKVGVGIGVAALIGTGAYLMLRSKPQTKSKPIKSQPIKSQKETLGSITLQ